MSQPRDDVPWQTDADDLHNGLEDQEDEVVERRMGIVRFLEDDEWRCGRHGERWRLDVGEAEGRWHSWQSDGLLFRNVEVERIPRKVSETESRSGAGLLVEFLFDSSALGCYIRASRGAATTEVRTRCSLAGLFGGAVGGCRLQAQRVKVGVPVSVLAEM